MECLDYLKQYIAAHGTSPSHDELKVALRLKSKSGTHRLVHALRVKGHVRFLNNRARSIEIVGADRVTRDFKTIWNVLNSADLHPDQWRSIVIMAERKASQHDATG